MNHIVSKLWVVAMAAAVAFGPAAPAANFPLGTQLVTGSVRNYLNELYSSGSAVTVQAANTNGDVLASSAVLGAAAGSNGENFLLEVPVTSVATSMSIAPGDPIRLCVIDGNDLKVAAATVSSPCANASIRADIRVVNVTEFDSKCAYTNASGKVAVANEYLDVWRSYADASRAYDPDADDDADGASNYFEYLSGTNPFDASDCLKIRSFALGADRSAAITFEYVGGHVYSVLSAASLKTPVWASEKTVMPASSGAEPGVTTITVVPTEKTPSRFFTLDPQ